MVVTNSRPPGVVAGHVKSLALARTVEGWSRRSALAAGLRTLTVPSSASRVRRSAPSRYAKFAISVVIFGTTAMSSPVARFSTVTSSSRVFAST